jgi:hypothetical protein
LPPDHREFQALWRLLRQAGGAEISARDAGPPPDDILELIRRFAEGTLDQTGRDGLIETLDARPDWIAHLASEIKTHRERGKDSR